MLSYFRSSRE